MFLRLQARSVINDGGVIVDWLVLVFGSMIVDSSVVCMIVAFLFNPLYVGKMFRIDVARCTTMQLQKT